MDLLRFTTAGSVDDGKSTLIGRLLYDSKSIFEDQMEAIEESSRKKGDEKVNLALLTDGLKAEREQGITIDVAYRYFATPKRKFIIADTPGHIQYTRNMVTGASTANLAIILIDARKGVIEQTKRHSFIANLLRIQHVVVAVNKMDLVDYDQDVYDRIVADYKAFASRLDNIVDITPIPMSALNGDNIVDKSSNMPWFEGASLLYHLENVYVSGDENHVQARFPVQWVIRPQSDKFHDFRGFAGRVAGGVFKPGDDVTVMPSGFSTKVKAIHQDEKELGEAFAPQSVTITLDDEIDISRGDMLVKANNPPKQGQDIEAMICWFSNTNLNPRGKFVIRHTTKETKAIVQDIRYKVDVNTLRKEEDTSSFSLNEIGRVSLPCSMIPTIKTGKPVLLS
jgi:sulfate adenylyltransferase subunit 1